MLSSTQMQCCFCSFHLTASSRAPPPGKHSPDQYTPPPTHWSVWSWATPPAERWRRFKNSLPAHRQNIHVGIMYDNAGTPCFHFHISLSPPPRPCPLARCNHLKKKHLIPLVVIFLHRWPEAFLSSFPSRRLSNLRSSRGRDKRSDGDLCLYRGCKKKGGGREETKWQEAMFSIRERRLASGRSHRRGAGFAECVLGILIHGPSSSSSSSSSSSPPHPSQHPPIRCFCMHDRKNRVQTQHGAPQTKHNNVTFSTSSVDDPEWTLSLSPL